MRKLMFFLAPVLLAAGCTQEIEFTEPLAGVEISEEIIEVSTRSLVGAVYNEVTDSWMVPQKDPYTLANFQTAYEKLSAGRSTQTLTQAVVGEFAAAKRLEATHYALKIYPRNEEEQWRVETMEDVQVAYIPFDYAQLTQEEVERLPRQIRTRSTADTFAEKSPYTVTYENYEVTDGGPTGPQTFRLPILYTVWPVGKPLPDDLEYVVDYEVFLPRSAVRTQSAGALLVMEREAVSAALGVKIIISPGDPDDPLILPPSLEGYVDVYDDQLWSYAPMTIPVRCQFGTNILDAYVDNAGHFTIALPTLPSGLMYHDIIPTTLTFTYRDQNNRWKITTESSTNPYSVSRSVTFEKVSGAYEYEHAHITLSSSARQENEIHRAATYFYNGQNDFPKHYPSGGTKIVAHSVSGRSYYSPNNHDINIYGYGRTSGDVVGSTLHELGHLFHDLNDQSPFSSTHIFLYESFACYASWYLSQKYYESLGWTSPYPSYDITTRNAQQEWEKTDAIGEPGGEYSPLFVDLTDNYNQRISSYYSSRPNDNIQGVPASVVWSVITSSQNWSQCRAKLLSYAGTGTGKYYTIDRFNEWIATFDDWANVYYK